MLKYPEHKYEESVQHRTSRAAGSSSADQRAAGGSSPAGDASTGFPTPSAPEKEDPDHMKGNPKTMTSGGAEGQASSTYDKDLAMIRRLSKMITDYQNAFKDIRQAYITRILDYLNAPPLHLDS